jgi:hypothetical protein
MQYDDGDERTQFEPSPWGSRQRVLPRHTFKAGTGTSSAARLPGVAPMEAPPVAANLVAPSTEPTFVPTFTMPVVSEADIPTWRVPKLALYPTKPRRQLDLTLWLPIGGLVSIVIIALLGAGLRGDPRADATSISAALLGEPSDSAFQIVANVEEPPAPPAPPAEEEVVVVAKPKHASVRAHHVARRRLNVDVSTPLGDLVRRRRR